MVPFLFMGLKTNIKFYLEKNRFIKHCVTPFTFYCMDRKREF